MGHGGGLRGVSLPPAPEAVLAFKLLTRGRLMQRRRPQPWTPVPRMEPRTLPQQRRGTGSRGGRIGHLATVARQGSQDDGTGRQVGQPRREYTYPSLLGAPIVQN